LSPTRRNDSLPILAVQVVRLLGATGQRLVLAESCTAGLVAASLATVPGVSRWLCGSAVTYREGTKTRWLGVPPELLKRHTAVSEEVTHCMAVQALQRTPEADLAAAVTGYLGPDAPESCDGLYYVALAIRVDSQEPPTIALADSGRLNATGRIARQQQAVERVLELLHRHLSTRGTQAAVTAAGGEDR
jgi:nicotinamide-nucleotide amidase